MHPEAETEILQSIRSGNHEKALQLIMNHFGKRLLYFLRSMLTQEQDAEDLYQDILLLVFKNLSQFKGESQVYSWIYTIAYREALRFLHHRKKSSFPLLPQEAAEPASHPGNANDPEKMWQFLHHAIRQLPEKQRLVFGLRYLEELDYRRISSITGLSETTCKTNYHYAVARIKKLISHEVGRF